MTGTLDLIENSISTMSKGHKAIAGFILESYDKAAYMTAARLGEEVGVSESTVVRFTTELGFEGYPEFQKALQEDLKSKLTSVQRLGLTEKFESDSEALRSVVNQDIANLLEEPVPVIDSCKAVVCCFPAALLVQEDLIGVVVDIEE